MKLTFQYRRKKKYLILPMNYGFFIREKLLTQFVKKPSSNEKILLSCLLVPRMYHFFKKEVINQYYFQFYNGIVCFFYIFHILVFLISSSSCASKYSLHLSFGLGRNICSYLITLLALSFRFLARCILYYSQIVLVCCKIDVTKKLTACCHGYSLKKYYRNL